MIQQLELPRPEATCRQAESLPQGLSEGAEVHRMESAAGDGLPQSLLLLVIPCCDLESPDVLASAWNWAEPDTPPDRREGLLVTLQGARVVWSPGRTAVLAPADRLESLRLALGEFALQEGEIRNIEQDLAQNWPHLEADGPLAFQFGDEAAPRREELGRRFQQVLALRSRLARLVPAIHRRPNYPPTLAGQLLERLKERTRLAERIEWLGGQLEVFERVYEMCGQRASEFTLSRKETTLEWVIIVLLAMETIILLIDLMAKFGR